MASTGINWGYPVTALVAGFIGALGPILTTVTQSRLKDKTERRNKKAEKFEEMVNTLYEHQHWLKVVGSIRVRGSEEKEGPSPLPKAQAIAAVYFPQFNDHISEIDKAAARVNLWALQVNHKGLEIDIEKERKEYEEVYKAYWEVFSTRVKEFVAFAEKEFR